MSCKPPFASKEGALPHYVETGFATRPVQMLTREGRGPSLSSLRSGGRYLVEKEFSCEDSCYRFEMQASLGAAKPVFRIPFT